MIDDPELMSEQQGLFDDELDLWTGMPGYDQRDRQPVKRIVVNFETMDDYAAFGEIVGVNLTPRSDTMWYPPIPNNEITGHKRYRSTTPRGPDHPVYIVSKGRWQNPLTSKALTEMGVAHHVIVEEQEFGAYANALDPSTRLLVLDPAYQEAYDTCDDLGGTKGRGPGPARNFAWDHAIDSGASWHWVMDDNIRNFHRLNRNIKIPVVDGTPFAVMEAFVSRFENVAMAGPAYHGLTAQRQQLPPYLLNTRIYSCNLIRNDTPYRWRGRYNEDTDLSLRMLKDGWVTVQFYAFLQHKLGTQVMAGGNTDEIYAADGTNPKSQMLADLHPDVARVVWKYNRWHHEVDYGRFKANVPRRRADVVVRSHIDDFGLVYEENVGGVWKPA